MIWSAFETAAGYVIAVALPIVVVGLAVDYVKRLFQRFDRRPSCAICGRRQMSMTECSWWRTVSDETVRYFHGHYAAEAAPPEWAIRLPDLRTRLEKTYALTDLKTLGDPGKVDLSGYRVALTTSMAVNRARDCCRRRG